MIDNQYEIANWRKSSRSHTNGDCVEVGSTSQVVGFRDTKHARVPDQPTIVVSRRAGAAFLAAVRGSITA